MLNMFVLAEDIAADGDTDTVLGPSATSDPAQQFYPGQTVTALLLTSDAFDGTVAIIGSDDNAVTWDKTELAALDLTTGKNKCEQIKVHEDMRITIASRTAGSVSVYILKGS